MTKLDSNVCKTIVILFKSFQFPSEICFLGKSSFQAQGKINLFFFISLMKFNIRYFYETIVQLYYTVTKKITNHLLQVYYLSHHDTEVGLWSHCKNQALW